jgi:hypothetical protein
MAILPIFPLRKETRLIRDAQAFLFPLPRLRGEGSRGVSAREKIRKIFSRNTCVRNVSIMLPSHGVCRVVGHLPQDRASFARRATENIFSHERSA